MSNLSNIGFQISSEWEFDQLLKSALDKSRMEKCDLGYYAIYSDPSGAELWLQFNNDLECIGMNPHFNGISKRKICITHSIPRTENILDGRLHCWADPSETDNPDSGMYPFIFDLPDMGFVGNIEFPKNFDAQLVGFPFELVVFKNEQEYQNSQDEEPIFASQSFIPIGLFSMEEEEQPSANQDAIGLLTGIIKEVERKKNELSGHEFWWMLVDTLGGEIDVVADPEYFEEPPSVGGVVQGQFWLSGRLYLE